MAASGIRSFFGRFFDTAFGYGVGGAASAAVEPIIAPFAQEAWVAAVQAGSGRVLDPSDLAAMAVQGVMDESDAAGEAAKSGMTEERFHRLFLVNGNPIAPEQALDLWNRGEISEEEVDVAIVQSRLKPEWVDRFKLLRKAILQASELANMVVQSVIPEEEATQRAAMLGIDAEDFHALTLLAGNPFGPETTLSLWNRGILDESEATLALRQSRLKPQWIEQFKQSRFRPVTAAQAAEGVVRQRITFNEGARIAAANGLDSDSFKLMVETAGRPISITQALALYNRGVFSEDDVKEVVARSNVRTEYTPEILKLRVRYPSLFQVRTLVSTGSIDDETAIKLLTDQGYPHELAGQIVGAAHKDKTQSDKDLVKGDIMRLYSEGAISRDDAKGMLRNLGYDDNESEFLVTISDFQKVAKFLNAAIGRVHTQFVNHRIDVDVVTTALDRLGVPTDQRENLIDLWTEERATNVKVLTAAEIAKAAATNLIQVGEAAAYLQNIGYSERDAAIYLNLHKVTVEIPP